MKKTIKTKGKMILGAMIVMTCATMFTGCDYYKTKLISKAPTSTQVVQTEAAQKVYDFLKKVKDNDYQGIQNDDERLKYLKIDAVATLVENTVKSDLVHSDNYELIRIDETDAESTDTDKIEVVTYAEKDKKNPKEFYINIDANGNIMFNTNGIDIKHKAQVAMPYGVECSIEGTKLAESLNIKSDITNGTMIYEIPYIATEFRASCTTADWGTLDTVAKIITDNDEAGYGKPLAVRFALKDTDASKVIEATKTMFNEIVANIGTETSDTDFSKYVAANKPELATMINTGLKTMSDDNMVTSVIMSSIAQSDKVEAPVYVFNNSGEVYVEAKIQNSWVYQGRTTQSEKVYCRYRIAKDTKNSNNSGYVFTWLAGTESGYPTLIGKVNSGWQNWK